MRDYYRHTRALYMHSTSLMQTFRLAQKEEEPAFVSFLARRGAKEEDLGLFLSRDGLIFPKEKKYVQGRSSADDEGIPVHPATPPGN